MVSKKYVIQSPLNSARQDDYTWVVSLSESDFLRFLTVKQGLEASSIRHCRIRISIFTQYLKENNLPLTPDAAESFLYYLRIDKELANNSLNTYVFMLRQLDLYAKDRNLPWQNFTKGMKSFEKTHPMIEVLSVDEIEKILDSHITYGLYRLHTDTSRLDHMYRTMLRFLACTGCRYDECASLRVKDVNLDMARATFIDTKNKQPRFAWISDPLTTMLKDEIDNKKPDELVFTTIIGHKVSPQSFIDDLRQRAKSVGIKKRVYPHLFRHSFATQLLVSGVEITRVASILGHKDIQTTFANYVHLADEQLKKATYHHPLIRKNINPREILRMIKDSFESFSLDTDYRFDYKLSEDNSSLTIGVKIK